MSPQLQRDRDGGGAEAGDRGSLEKRQRAILAMLEAGQQPDVVNGWSTARLASLYPRLGEVRVTEHLIATPAGHVPARVYHARTAAPRDTLVWVHGGGFVVGSLDMPEAHWVGLATAAAGASAVTLGYHKALHGVTFPTPSDDVLAGWTWAEATRQSLDLGPRMHLGGASAGGNLVAGVAKRLAQGEGTVPSSVIMTYPFVSTDLLSALTHSDEERTAARIADLGGHHYAGAAGVDNPIAFAANGPVPDSHPRTLFLLADKDIFTASALQYAAKLAAAGVMTEVTRLPGSEHAFLNEPGARAGEEAMNHVVAWVTGQ